MTRETRAWRDAHDRALSADVPLRDWIALLDGVPVAAAALFVGAGVAGIYNVATVPEARGRGIGRAVTAAALAEAVARGQRTAVLGSSEMGYPGLSAARLPRRVAAAVVRPTLATITDPARYSLSPADRRSRTPSPACSTRCRPARADRG